MLRLQAISKESGLHSLQGLRMQRDLILCYLYLRDMDLYKHHNFLFDFGKQNSNTEALLCLIL